MERLDRAYCNRSHRDLYLEALLWNFPIFISDHGPILFDSCPKKVERKKRPYKIEAWALSFLEVTAILDSVWKEEISGSRMFVFKQKLKRAREKLKKGCLNYRDEHRINWNQIQGTLTDIQLNITSEQNIKLEKEMRNKMEQEVEVKNMFWKERAKSK
ncbi:uncharacterized protein LOC110732560 [Chenopodium quinoa]|uniref:uncharacterized protein LOC110732560 n=1 Tax=Chenopodium quinoa TaxID=63459 RepID=UPI000B793BC0|nr:uncharacterized protein LOC110732560 [Chenopodium quinoa]